VFESPRARWAKPLVEAVSVRMRLPDLGHRLCHGSDLRERSSGAILHQKHGLAGEAKS